MSCARRSLSEQEVSVVCLDCSLPTLHFERQRTRFVLRKRSSVSPGTMHPVWDTVRVEGQRSGRFRPVFLCSVPLAGALAAQSADPAVRPAEFMIPSPQEGQKKQVAMYSSGEMSPDQACLCR